MKRSPVIVAISLFALNVGCSDDKGSSSGGGDTAGSGDESGGSSADDGSDGGDDGSGSGGTGATDTGDDGPNYARGIRISKVTANQGVEEDIGLDGEGVDAAQRNLFLIRDRNVLIRAHWEIDADWEPREIEAVITLSLPDMEDQVASDKWLVEGESYEGQLDTTFWWYVPAELALAGLQYKIELFEVNDSQAGVPVPDPPPVFPSSGSAYVGLEDREMELKVTIIPINHVWEDCDRTPNVTQEDVDAMANALEITNPVQEVIATLRDPFPWTSSIGDSGFSPLLSGLSQQRGPDGAGPNEYYYGLVWSCDGGPGSVVGQALGIPSPTKGNAYARVSAGLWGGSGAGSSGTFIHEVGHTQGRRHVECSGSEGGPDPAYPHEGGLLGRWGFGIHSWELVNPTTGRDYMTYCGNYWVSDYGWNFTYETIKVLTSWDYGGDGVPEPRAAPEPVGDLLVGALYPDGKSDWWTTKGTLLPGQAVDGASIDLEQDGKIVATVPAATSLRPHGTTVNVAVPLPAQLDRATALTFKKGDVTARAATSEVKRLHQYR